MAGESMTKHRRNRAYPEVIPMWKDRKRASTLQWVAIVLVLGACGGQTTDEKPRAYAGCNSICAEIVRTCALPAGTCVQDCLAPLLASESPEQCADAANAFADCALVQSSISCISSPPTLRPAQDCEQEARSANCACFGEC
jgi:hypothetical protein